MSPMPLPPEGLVNRMVPVLCRVVGVAFVGGGLIGFVLVPVLLFAQGENTLLTALVFLGVSILNVAAGFVVVKYVPSFMLSRFRKFRESSPS